MEELKKMMDPTFCTEIDHLRESSADACPYPPRIQYRIASKSGKILMEKLLRNIKYIY